MQKAIAAAVVALVLVSSAGAKPVPSLTPAKTMKLWHALVAREQHTPRVLAAAADCRPSRIVMYAPTDWLRLATKLAQNSSPCAQYYISVPPLTSDKTQPRPNQAPLIRALEPNMHALAEISYAAWAKWVAANNSDWFTAGVTARQRMAAAGYDVAAGDTWAMNEATSAVRKNTGSARSNLSEFLRGLDDGGGDPAKGVVFVIGVGQPGDQSGYRIVLQSWLQDTTFWTNVSQYVSDWMQEDYGDMREYAVAGASAQQRRDALVQYLGHPLALATAGADQSTVAQQFLAADYGPLANAAWAYSSSYGWTSVPYAQMEDYVSAQTYAARAFDAENGLPDDRFGFGWSPANTIGLSANDFTSQTAQILQRLAQAIVDSGTTVDPTDPGVGACGPLYQNLWCDTVIPGAAFTSQWASFSTWTQTGVAFANTPVTITAGAVSPPLTVQLRTGSAVTIATTPQTVTLTTTSTKGGFSTSAAGPFTPALDVTIPAGASSATFYYQDTVAGTPTVSATLPGQPPATQTLTVAAAAPTALKISPRSVTVVGGTTRLFAAEATDAYGNPTGAAATWTVASAKLGTLNPVSGTSTTFTASKTAAGRGRVTAVVGSLSASAIVTVTRPPARIGGVLTRRIDGHVVVTTWVVSGNKRVKGALVSLIVRRGSSLIVNVTGRTDVHGRFTWHSTHVLPPGHYVARAILRSRSTS